jgi:proteasome accessory factor B
VARIAGDSVPYNHPIRFTKGGFLYSAVERLVNLALYLAAAREPVSAEDIRVDVQGYEPNQSDDAFKRQFERDKDDLRTAGLVILADAENEGLYHLDRSATFAAPLNLTAREAAAVQASASALLDDPSFPFSDDLRLAMAKIASAVDLGDVPAAARLADEDPGQQGAIVAQLAEAAGHGKSVSFGYTNSQGVSSPHKVEPYGLFLHDGRWYLVGRDTAKDEPRTYTVARMSGIAVNPTRPKSPDFQRPDGFDVASFVRLPFQYGSADAEFEALIRFEASALWRLDSLSAGCGEIEPDEDGALWRVPARSQSRLLQFVIDSGPGLRLAGPPSAVAALDLGLAEVIRAHG